MNEHVADPFRAILNAFAHPVAEQRVDAILNPCTYPPAPVHVGNAVEIECAVCLGNRFDDEGNPCAWCSNRGYIVTERDL
jgi:hypothetical protein